jgi:hypothetical protein
VIWVSTGLHTGTWLKHTKEFFAENKTKVEGIRPRKCSDELMELACKATIFLEKGLLSSFRSGKFEESPEMFTRNTRVAEMKQEFDSTFEELRDFIAWFR